MGLSLCLQSDQTKNRKDVVHWEAGSHATVQGRELSVKRGPLSRSSYSSSAQPRGSSRCTRPKYSDPPPNLHTQLLRAILETQGSQSLDSKERAPFSTLSFLFYPVPIIVRPQARSETDEKIFFFPFDGSLTNLSRSCRESCREHRLFCRGAESAYQTWADALLLLSDCLEKGKHTMK